VIGLVEVPSRPAIARVDCTAHGLTMPCPTPARVQVAVQNGLVAADDAAAGALVAWLPGGVPFHEWQDEPMVRTYAAQRQQADGSTVFSHFQVDIAPLMINLTESLYEQLARYLLSDAAASDHRSRSRRPPAPSASSSAAATATPPAPPSRRHNTSSAYGLHTPLAEADAREADVAKTPGQPRQSKKKGLFMSPFRWGGGGGAMRSGSRHALISAR
jgi:hypothetical protein